MYSCPRQTVPNAKHDLGKAVLNTTGSSQGLLCCDMAWFGYDRSHYIPRITWNQLRPYTWLHRGSLETCGKGEDVRGPRVPRTIAVYVLDQCLPLVPGKHSSHNKKDGDHSAELLESCSWGDGNDLMRGCTCQSPGLAGP